MKTNSIYSIGRREAIYRTEKDRHWNKPGVQYRNCLPGGLSETGLKQLGWKLVGYCVLKSLK